MAGRARTNKSVFRPRHVTAVAFKVAARGHRRVGSTRGASQNGASAAAAMAAVVMERDESGHSGRRERRYRFI